MGNKMIIKSINRIILGRNSAMRKIKQSHLMKSVCEIRERFRIDWEGLFKGVTLGLPE